MKKRIRYFLITVLTAFLIAPSVFAGTQDCAGYIIGVTYTSDTTMRINVKTSFIEYMSRGNEALQTAYYTTYETGLHGNTVCMVNDKLVSLETMMNTVKVGQYGWFYEDIFINVYVTPDFEYGKLIDFDNVNNTVTIKEPRAKTSGNYISSPDTTKVISYTDNADFFLEDVVSDEATTTTQLGNWMQIHPPRNQLIWVETDISQYDYTSIKDPSVAGRGDANSNTGPGFITGLGFDKNSDRGPEMTWLLQGNWIDTTYRVFYSTLDGKRATNEIAYRPGRRMVAACYRSHATPQYLYVTSRNDEIRGTVLSVNGNDIEIEAEDWDGNLDTVTVSYKSTGEVMLDGIATNFSNAVQVGREIRVFPERLNERLVLLKNYRKEQSATSYYEPIAHYKPDEYYAFTGHEFTFDGSYSYDHDGTISSYSWDFGDGNTATGPVVTHTFNNGSNYERYRVVLTVTNTDGETSSDTKVIPVMPGPLASVDINKEKLIHGAHYQNWNSTGCTLETVCTNPDYETYFQQTLDFNDHLDIIHNIVDGYFEAPEDGWYEFRVVGTYQTGSSGIGMKLWIGDNLVVDSYNNVNWGILGQNSRLTGHIYLEAGLHPYKLKGKHEGHYMAIGWSGPGVELKDGLWHIRNEDLYYNPYDYNIAYANMSVDNNFGDAPFTVNFNSEESVGEIASYSWDFKDGNSSTQANPSHTYTDPGYYNVLLTVTDTEGRVSKDSMLLMVGDPAASNQKIGNSLTFSSDHTSHPDSVAGIVPLINWTNRSITTFGSDKEFIEKLTLLNSYGEETSATLNGSYSKGLEVSNNTSTGDQTFMSEGIYMQSGKEILIEDIPQEYIDSTYDLYIYSNAITYANKDYKMGSDTIHEFNVNGTSKWIKFSESSTWDGNFVESTATTLSGAQSGPATNYFVLQGLTDTAISITTPNKALICGMQIVTDFRKREQTVDFDPVADKLTTDPDFQISAKATSGLALTYSVVSGPATVSGNVVALTGSSGLVELKATQVGNDLFNAAEDFVSFPVADIAKTDQTISIDSIPDKFTTDADFTVNATATSGNAVSLEVTSGPATLSGSTVSLTGEAGIVTILAKQSGDATYNPAKLTYETFVVSVPKQTATFTVANANNSVAVFDASITVGGQTIKTDVIGVAKFDLPDGSYSYEVTKEDFITKTGSITISGGDITENISLNPIAYHWVTFSVTDGSSNPVEGVSVTISGEGTVTTDASGIAVKELLDATSYNYTATKAEYFDATGSFTISGSDHSENVTINAMPKYTATFVVKDNNAVAVENATVIVNNDTLSTNTSGEVTIDLIDGSYTYTAQKLGYVSNSGTITVSGAPLTENVTIDIIPTYTVTFNVTDDMGNDEEGVNITIETTTITSDATGTATIEVPDGSYNYTATKTGHFNTTGSITVSGATLSENVVMDSIYPAVFDSVAIEPDPAALKVNEAINLTATAFDQYGTILTPDAITWSVDGLGSIEQTGQFLAGTTAGSSKAIAEVTIGATTIADTQDITILADFVAISMNLYKYGSEEISPSELAGASEFSASNWNNSNADDATGTGLIDSDGNSTTASFELLGTSTLGKYDGNSVDKTSPDNRLMQACRVEPADDTVLIKVTAPSDYTSGAGWKLVLYWYNHNNSGTVQYTLRNDGRVFYMKAADGTKFDNNHRQSTATTAIDAQPGYNYIVFDSIMDQTATVFSEDVSSRAGACGFQIIREAAPATAKQTQTITFNELDTVTYGDPDFDLTATASSGLTVSYASSNTAVATVSGNTVSIVGVGSTIITASQAGDSDYYPAVDVDQELVVLDQPVRVKTAIASNEIIVYPVPTNDMVWIKGVDMVNATLYNTLGVVIKYVENTNTVNLQELPNGVYFLKIEDQVFRLIKE